jgi:hypothetical protein
MNKRFTKLILGGTIAVVFALTVAGTASARIAIPPSQQGSQGTSSYTSSLLGYPKGVVGAPGFGTTESSQSYLLGYPRGIVGAPGLPTAEPRPVTQHVQKQTFASSYGDFPEVVRTMGLGTAAHTSTSSNSFDWDNVWIGAAIGIGVLCIAGLCAFGIRRSKATPATA